MHKFLLADNRHYPFYVFKLLNRHWAGPLLLVPVYVFAIWSVSRTVGEPMPRLLRLETCSLYPPALVDHF